MKLSKVISITACGLCMLTACCTSTPTPIIVAPSPVTCVTFDPPSLISCLEPPMNDAPTRVINGRTVKLCVDKRTDLWTATSINSSVMRVDGKACHIMQVISPKISDPVESSGDEDGAKGGVDDKAVLPLPSPRSDVDPNKNGM